MRGVSVLLLLVGSVLAEDRPIDESFPATAARVPYLALRLTSARWQVRYCLLLDLGGRDPECKRLLERLCRDPHPRVRNQAVVRYVYRFPYVDRALVRLEDLPGVRFPLRLLPAVDRERALADWCAGRPTPWLTEHRVLPAERGGGLRKLDPKQRDSAAMAAPLRVAGLYGRPSDLRRIAPFLDSANEFVRWEAALAAIRLGANERGFAVFEALLDEQRAESESNVFQLLPRPERRDADAKRDLVRLWREGPSNVRGPALGRYLYDYLLVDRSLVPVDEFPLAPWIVRRLPEADRQRALVDWCVGRPTPWFGGIRCGTEMLGIPWPLDPEKAPDLRMCATLRIVGYFGEADDVEFVKPFLRSPNERNALEAAKAVIRLGDRDRGIGTLRELTRRPLTRDSDVALCALAFLRELGDEGLRECAGAMVEAADASEDVPPRLLSHLLLIAAEWKPGLLSAPLPRE